MNDSLRAAIEAVKAWMQANSAPRLAANLAPGASIEELNRFQGDLGVRFPASLRDLYQIHDGQPAEFDCFIGSLNFLGMRQAARSRETLLARYVQGRFGVLGYRENSDAWDGVVLLEQELTDRWWPLARMDGDFLVLNLDSERVFWAHKDVPPLSLAADTLTDFFATYARRLDAGEYVLEEGFGEYYLQVR